MHLAIIHDDFEGVHFNVSLLAQPYSLLYPSFRVSSDNMGSHTDPLLSGLVPVCSLTLQKLMDISSLTNQVHEMLFSKSAEQKLSRAVSSQSAEMGIFPVRFISSILPQHITNGFTKTALHPSVS